MPRHPIIVCLALPECPLHQKESLPAHCDLMPCQNDPRAAGPHRPRSCWFSLSPSSCSAAHSTPGHLHAPSSPRSSALSCCPQSHWCASLSCFMISPNPGPSDSSSICVTEGEKSLSTWVTAQTHDFGEVLPSAGLINEASTHCMKTVPVWFLSSQQTPGISMGRWSLVNRHRTRIWPPRNLLERAALGHGSHP